jgi:hypothetical protein
LAQGVNEGNAGEGQPGCRSDDGGCFGFQVEAARIERASGGAIQGKPCLLSMFAPRG